MIISCLLFVLILFLSPIYEQSSLLPIMTIMIQLAYFLKYIVNKKQIKLHLFFIFGVLYLNIILINTFWSNDASYYGYALRIFTNFFQLLLGVEFFTIVLSDSNIKIKIKNIFNKLTILISIYIIYEGITQTNPIFSRLFRDEWYNKIIYFYARGYRAAGSMESPLVMSFPIVISFFFIYYDLRIHNISSIKKFFSLFIYIIAVYFLKTRTIIVMIFLLVIIMESYKIYNSKKKYTNYFTFLLTCILGIISLINLRTVFESDFMSYVHRFTSVKFVLSEFIELNIINIIFGKGFGSLAYKVYSEQITITDVGFYAIDNEIITFLFEFGVIGIVLITLFLLYLYFGSATKENKVFNLMGLSILLVYSVSFNYLHWFSLAFITSYLISNMLLNTKGDYTIDF